AVRVNKETLSAQCFSRNIKGDLITLVQEKLRCSFSKALKTISNIVNFKETEKIEYQLPFGGFYKNIQKLRNDVVIDIETYSESILDEYGCFPNLMFYEDGILPEVQMKYHVGFDTASNRLTIPWYSMDGNSVIGVMGRLNKRVVSTEESKWLPVIPFPKSKGLYGFSENYKSIREKGILMIGESEKHCQQLESKGLPIGLSLGGNNLSKVQANHIKSMFPKTVLVAFDEGLEREQSHHVAEQLKMQNYYKNSVGYIYDKSGLYLKKGLKQSPSDLPKQDLHKLIKECVTWI
ncbi:hypothetical protein ACFVRU_51105, partial [Streptomyces sp. NPDC057927]